MHLQNGSIKVDSKNNYNCDIGKTSISKGKAKSHIPISTVSAAMNVAVNMRQLTGNKSPSSNGNCNSDKNLSNLEYKKIDNNIKNFSNQAVNGEDSGFSESYKGSKHKVKKTKQSNGSKGKEESDVFSSASSENTAVQDDNSSNATSVESDAFFISSDESEGESSDIFIKKYGSSTSISTLSNGSLNSLLSRTGTEMASSTGTLTSIGIERYPTPPPPPPPFITVAPTKEVLIDSSSAVSSTDENIKSPTIMYNTLSKSNRKPVSPKKPSKIESNKNEKLKNLDSKKNIFTNLVNTKLRIKKQHTPKDSKNNNPIARPETFIDMYGNNSPQNAVQYPTFLKEHIHSVSEAEPQTYLQSFLPKNSNLKSVEETESVKCSKVSHVYKEVDDINELSLPSLSSSSSDITVKGNEVPLKYVQKVVVTPISRQNIEEQKMDKYMCRKSLFQDNTKFQGIEKDTDVKIQPHCQIEDKHFDKSISGSHSYRPQRPNTFQIGVKPAARVVLDPDGRVIYTTNSLDRRLPCEFSNQFQITRTNMSDKEYCVPPSPKNIGEISSCNVYLPSKSYGHQTTFKEVNVNNRPRRLGYSILDNKNTTNINYPQNNENCPNFSEYSPCVPNLNYRTISPKSMTETQSYQIKSCNSPSLRPIAKISLPPYEEAIISNHVLIPNPNVAGLPNTETKLTEQNINIHLQNMERLNKISHVTSSNSPEISNKVSYPYENIATSMENNLARLKGSTMSTEDLFAVIHDCKKRMNIKTDSDISSSSRSNSPSYFRTPPPPKGTLAETGFLSPRSPPFNLNCTRDRRSWADFRSVSSSPDEKRSRSLASDRLGRSKPTSMYDFKMLLLQARSTTQISGPRKSAVELLKVPSPSFDGANALSPTRASPHFSYSHQNSPNSPTYIHNGHSTVPFKRHNNRARSSLQSRYTMYPPIFEDCSEENENVRDIIPKPLNS